MRLHPVERAALYVLAMVAGAGVLLGLYLAATSVEIALM
jgi:hypothetical protein